MWYLRVLGMVVVLVLMLAPVTVAYKLNRRATAYALTRLTYRLIAHTMNLRVRVRGNPTSARPLLLVSNHVSYLDIIAYGAVMPVVFTPKSDIARWPLIGAICKLTGCIFIDRKAIKTAENMENIRRALQGERPVLLFAEGTTSDSKRILPLRSSYFSIVQNGEGVMVQPALIAYTKIHGLPVDTTTRPRIAWYGDMDLLPHFIRMLQSGPIQADIEFMPPVNPQAFENRKQLSAHLEQVLDAAHQRVL